MPNQQKPLWVFGVWQASLWGWIRGRLNLKEISFLSPCLMSPDTEAPVLQGESFSYLVEPVGGSVRLDCVVRGDPTPDIYWIKDGLPLRGGRLRHRLQNGSLIIRRTEARRGPGLGWGHPGQPLLCLMARDSCSVGWHHLIQSTKHFPAHTQRFSPN